MLSSPNGLLSLSLLTNLSVTTYLNGVAQETSDSGGLLGLQLLGLLNDNTRQLVVINTTQNFDEVEIEQAAVVGALSALDLYAVCVAPPAL